MYIILRGDISPTAAFLAYGHATLGTYLTWQDDPVMKEWQQHSFAKVALLAIDQAHLDLCKSWGEHRVFTESALWNAETCIGLRVMPKYDPRLRTLPKWTQQ